MYINLVILRVGANKVDVYDSIGVVDPNDKSILVSRNIKHHPAIFEDTRVPEVLLYLSR
ncbi:hypothetical protein NTGM5_170028 [Candidatus Nitrotoga sp. M5]|nr:hypothetical protein NTGM5_170028 [Candidatus Nitrotoga sp. M5]